MDRVINIDVKNSEKYKFEDDLDSDREDDKSDRSEKSEKSK